jgi:hypothetical protein
MKKILLLSMFLALTVMLPAFSQAPLIHQPFNSFDLSKKVLGDVYVPFSVNYTSYGNTGQWLVAQIDYVGMVGDSCKVKFYVSATESFTGITTALNASSFTTGTALNSKAWKTGLAYGKNVTKYEMINVSNYPTGFVRAIIDTTTGIDTGKVTVTIKPYNHICSNTDMVSSNLLKTPSDLNYYNVATKSIKSQTITFFPNNCVDKIAYQVQWIGMAGHSCNVKVFASGSENFIDTTRINSTTNVKWTTGANITKWDTVDVRTIPIVYLKTTIDTCSGATGHVRVTYKPIFK